MGYLSDILKDEYNNLKVREVYSSKLGNTDVEIVRLAQATRSS